MQKLFHIRVLHGLLVHSKLKLKFQTITWYKLRSATVEKNNNGKIQELCSGNNHDGIKQVLHRIKIKISLLDHYYIKIKIPIAHYGRTSRNIMALMPIGALKVKTWRLNLKFQTTTLHDTSWELQQFKKIKIKN